MDALLEDYAKDGIVDERRELLMKNTAAQIYAGQLLKSAMSLYLIDFCSQPGLRRFVNVCSDILANSCSEAVC